MLAELQEKVAGVGILIVVPEDRDRGFISLRELRSRRSTHKVAGSRTLPMESTNPGENWVQTLARLTREEIQLQNFTYNPDEVMSQKVCTCELRPAVYVSIHLLQLSPEVDVIIGSESQEVSDLRWMPFQEVIEAPKNDLSLRPGSREAVLSYLDYLKNPAGFLPSVYKYTDLIDQVPDVIFDLIEGGVSLKEALFRLGWASAPFARSVVLPHWPILQESPLNFAQAK